MRALVTGSAGFIGRHLSRELEERGWEVYGIDPTGDRTAKRPGTREYAGGPTVWSHSLYHKHDAMDLFTSGVRMKFDLVAHCAYHVGGRAAIDGTNTNLFKNLQLDSAMFDWAVRTGQRRVLYFSSSAVYPVDMQEKRVWEGYKTNPFTRDKPERMMRLREGEEITEWLVDNDYGYAKCVGERLAQRARDNGVPVTVVRPFSGYGEDQSLDYPFPSIIRRVKEGDLSVWGPPGQTRDWIHVSDVVSGALAAVESGTADPVNLCTGVGTEMGELAKAISLQLHLKDCFTYGGSQDITYDTSKPTGVFYRVGDPTRMLNYYTPQVSLEEGIRRALETGVA